MGVSSSNGTLCPCRRRVSALEPRGSSLRRSRSSRSSQRVSFADGLPPQSDELRAGVRHRSRQADDVPREKMQPGGSASGRSACSALDGCLAPVLQVLQKRLTFDYGCGCSFRPSDVQRPSDLTDDAGTVNLRGQLAGRQREDRIRELKAALRDPAIQTLCLEDNGLSVRELTPVFRTVANSNHLTLLSLGSNRLGDEGAQALAAALANSRAPIRVLALSNNGLGDEGAAALAGVLEGSQVEVLDLRDNHIGVIGARALARALQSHSAVRSLQLRGNAVGDEGAAMLAEVIHYCPGMEKLCLEKNGISDRGVRFLSAALRGGLTMLLSDNNVSKVGKQGLSEARRAIQHRGGFCTAIA